MVESSEKIDTNTTPVEATKKDDPSLFDRHVYITIRNKNYGNRLQPKMKRQKIDGRWQQVPVTEENGKPVLEPINIDLPGTIADEVQFNRVLNNFEFGEDNTTKIVCQEASYDDLKAALD